MGAHIVQQPLGWVSRKTTCSGAVLRPASVADRRMTTSELHVVAA